MDEPRTLRFVGSAESRRYRPLHLSDLKLEGSGQPAVAAQPASSAPKLLRDSARPADFPVESQEERAAREVRGQELDAMEARGEIDVPAAPKKIPTWADITGHPGYQALGDEDKEEARLHYWSNFVAPEIATEDLTAARARFDELTRPPKPLTERRRGEPPLPLEQQLASRPARAVATRKGGVQVQPVDIEDVDRYDAPDDPRAPWTGDGGVLSNAPAGMVAAGKNAVANLGLMLQEERSQGIARELQTGESPEQRAASTMARSAIRGRRFSEAPAEVDVPVGANRPADSGERAAALKRGLAEATRSGEEMKRWAAETRRELELVTPADMDTVQQAVWSAVQSAPPTALGLAVGIVTRNPASAMAIAGGGGGAFQAGSTYGEAREKGASHDVAARAAMIDAVLEGVGEAIPLAAALKPGSSFLVRLGKVIPQEAGQEGITQLAQDLNAFLTYNPDITLGEAWQNFKVATLAGAIGGTVYGSVGHAVDRARDTSRSTQPAMDLHEGHALSKRIAGEVDIAPRALVSEPRTASVSAEHAAGESRPMEDLAGHDQIEVLERPGTSKLREDAPVFVIDQIDPATGNSQPKAMLGYSTEKDALQAHVEQSGAPRGIKDWLSPGKLSELAGEDVDLSTAQGRTFHRLELRDAPTEHPTGPVEALGRLRKVVYWPEGKEIPAAYQGEAWVNDGLWEARWTHNGKIGLWRDFTGGERAVWQGIRSVRAMSLTEFRTQHNAPADTALQMKSAGPGALRNPRNDVRAPAGRVAANTSMAQHDATSEDLAAVDIEMNAPYIGGAAEQVADQRRARPDAIRQAIRELLRVPINEGGFKTSRDALGLYKTKARTIRVRNQNDIGVIAHETGHHFSETSRQVRDLIRAHQNEIRAITPYAASQQTAALQREEGFAEYLRLRWTSPTKARASAPQFSAAFERYVEQNGYRPAFDAIEGAIRDWQNLPPAERILAKVGEPEKPLGRRISVDRIAFEVFDRWLPMRRMVEDLKPDIAPSADPFKLAHLLAGDAALIEDWLLRETVPFNFGRRADLADRGKPLSEILKPIQDQQREFGAYLIAKRANELMRRGKEHLYSADEIAAGLQIETPEFKAAAAELYRYQDRLLDYAVEGGLLSQFVADKFRQFPFYVPFFRVGEPIARHGDIFKEIHGGTENLRDPIANVIENTVRVIHATNRNYVLAKAHDLALEIPGGGRWIETVPMPERAVRIETDKIIEALREQGVEIDEKTAETVATSLTFFVKNPLGDERNRIIVVRRSGRAYALQINDEMLWEALERFEPVDMGLVEKILSVPADVLRAGIVLSPEFMARNFARDTLSGFIQSKAGILPVAGTLNGFKEVATRSDAARLYRAFGGAYGDMWRADSGVERKLVERMARRGGFDPRTIVTPRGLISLLHRLGSITEAGTRVAEFKKSMGTSGIDELIDAAYNAREVSVDFGMHGHSRSVRFLTRITPFLNPALQGWYKVARTTGSRPVTTALRGAMLAAASIALYLLNRGEDWYDELERWEKNTYWHVDIGLRTDGGKVIALRIPKPFEWGGLFGSIPEALAEVAIEQHGQAFLKRLKSIANDVFSVRVIPTALLVPAELWANKSQFTGRPIVPESKERLPAEMQSTPGTSLAARRAGEIAGASPAKIDHAVRGLFGTLGSYTLMLADQAIRAVDDEPDTLPLPWQKSPLLRVFLSDSSGANSRYVTELYELLTEARHAEAAMRLLDREDFAAFVDKHERELRSYPMLAGGSQALAELRRDNERTIRSRAYSTEEKLRRINENNERIREISKSIVQRVDPSQERSR